MRKLLMIFGVILMLPGMVYGAEPMLKGPAGAGSLILVRGIARLWYWPSGAEGHNAEVMAKKMLKGREYMANHDGDWCAFWLTLPDSASLQLDSTSVIEIDLANGERVLSQIVMALDGPSEEHIWIAGEDTLIFKNGGCVFGRSVQAWPGAYPLYARFPAGSCLTGKVIDERSRAFRSRPISLRLVQQGGERP
jgi:hypothetical protein